MKQILLVGLLMLTTACSHQNRPEVNLAKPVQIPDLPTELSVRAQKLPPLTDTSLAAQQLDAVNTDKAYNDKAWQVNNLIDFYNCIKDAVNNKSSLETCKLLN